MRFQGFAHARTPRVLHFSAFIDGSGGNVTGMEDVMKLGMKFPKPFVSSTPSVGSATSNWIAGTTQGIGGINWVGAEFNIVRYSQKE